MMINYNILELCENSKLKQSVRQVYQRTIYDTDEKEWLKKIIFKKLQIKDTDNKTKYAKYHGAPQPTLVLPEGDYRASTDMIVMKGNKILIDFSKDRGGCYYQFPGGGLDGKESLSTAATRECQEEALITPKNVEYTGIIWIFHYEPATLSRGQVRFVCVGQYDKDYKGYVKIDDRDEFVDNAEWVDYRKVDLKEPHKAAIEIYLEKYPIQEASFMNHLYKIK